MHLPLFQTDHPTENIASVNTCKASTVPHWFHTGIHTEAHWFHTVPHWLGLKVKVFILTYSHIHFHISLLSHSPENGKGRVIKKIPEMRLFYLITAIIARPMLTMLTAWLQDQMFILEKEFHIWWFWVTLLWSGNGKPWNTVVAIAEDLYSQTLSLLNI